MRNLSEDVGNLDLREQRKRLFSLLNHVIQTCTEKFDREKARNSDRQKWARILINCVDSYGKLLETSALEDLENRIDDLEKTRT